MLRTLQAEDDDDEGAGSATTWAATLGIVAGIALLMGGGYVFRGPIKHFLNFFIDIVDDWGVWGYIAYAAVYAGGPIYTSVEMLSSVRLIFTAGSLQLQ